jgi:hypothetical protein
MEICENHDYNRYFQKASKFEQIRLGTKIFFINADNGPCWLCVGREGYGEKDHKWQFCEASLPTTITVLFVKFIAISDSSEDGVLELLFNKNPCLETSKEFSNWVESLSHRPQL